MSSGVKLQKQKPESFFNKVLNWFRPSYDEATLFLLALICVLYLLTYLKVEQIVNFVFAEAPSKIFWIFVALVLIAIYGFSLSIYHGFSKREKRIGEKTAMATFAMLVSGISGIAIAVEMLKNSPNWLIVFPVLNGFSGLLLLYQIGLSPEKSVRDENAGYVDIFLGSLVVMTLFIGGYFWLRLNGVEMLSICIVYAISVHGLFRQIVKEVKIFITSNKNGK